MSSQLNIKKHSKTSQSHKDNFIFDGYHINSEKENIFKSKNSSSQRDNYGNIHHSRLMENHKDLHNKHSQRFPKDSFNNLSVSNDSNKTCNSFHNNINNNSNYSNHNPNCQINNVNNTILCKVVSASILGNIITKIVRVSQLDSDNEYLEINSQDRGIVRCGLNCKMSSCFQLEKSQTCFLFLAGSQIQIWKNNANHFNLLVQFNKNSFEVIGVNNIEIIRCCNYNEFILISLYSGNQIFFYMWDPNNEKLIQFVGMLPRSRSNTIQDFILFNDNFGNLSILLLDICGYLSVMSFKLNNQCQQFEEVFIDDFKLGTKIESISLKQIEKDIICVCHLGGVTLLIPTEDGSFKILARFQFYEDISYNSLYCTSVAIHMDQDGSNILLFCGDRVGNIWRGKININNTTNAAKIPLELFANKRLHSYVCCLMISKEENKNRLKCISFFNEEISL